MKIEVISKNAVYITINGTVYYIDDSTGEITSPSRLDSAGPSEIQFGSNTWVNRNIYIKNIVESL